MNITFLGTGTSHGVPVVACQCRVCQSTDPSDKHLRTSALVRTDEGENILIDIGPDFRMQMLSQQVTHLEGILITHAHRDHVAGLDDIRSLNYLQGCSMQVYGNEVALTTIQRDYRYIFEPHPYPGLPEVDLHVVDNDPFMVASHQVMPIKALHKDLPILGYRIGKLAYITDASFIPPEQIAKLQGVEVLVVNALRKEKHFSHFCLADALEVVNQVKPREAYLTHVSHEMGLMAEEAPLLPPHVHFALDGLTVEV